CDWGTRGPLGAGGASLSRTPPRGWLGAGCVAPGWTPEAGGVGGPCDDPAPGASNTDGARSLWVASNVKSMLVLKKAAASPAVTRVRKLAAPRPVMKPPPPPMPRAPPSERCSSTTPTRAAAIIKCRMSKTVIIAGKFPDDVPASLLHPERVEGQHA